MDLYHETSEYRQQPRHNHTLNAIVDFSYLAPAKLARDEAHERMRAEAALRAFGDGHDLAVGSSQRTHSVRHHLGDILVLIGTRLQGAHGVATPGPAASGP